ESTRSVRAEVEAQLVVRERRTLLVERRVDCRAEVHRVGPFRAGEAFGLEWVHERLRLRPAPDQTQNDEPGEHAFHGSHGSSMGLFRPLTYPRPRANEQIEVNGRQRRDVA